MLALKPFNGHWGCEEGYGCDAKATNHCEQCDLRVCGLHSLSHAGCMINEKKQPIAAAAAATSAKKQPAPVALCSECGCYGKHCCSQCGKHFCTDCFEFHEHTSDGKKVPSKPEAAAAKPAKKTKKARQGKYRLKTSLVKKPAAAAAAASSSVPPTIQTVPPMTQIGPGHIWIVPAEAAKICEVSTCCERARRWCATCDDFLCTRHVSRHDNCAEEKKENKPTPTPCCHQMGVTPANIASLPYCELPSCYRQACIILASQKEENTKKKKKPAVKRKQQPLDDELEDDLDKLLDAVADSGNTPVAKKAKTPSAAESVKLLRDEAAAKTAEADKIEAELKAAERKARLTPPFELFHGAVFDAEYQCLSIENNRIEKPLEDEWTVVRAVHVNNEEWWWKLVEEDGPLCVVTAQRNGRFDVYRKVERVSNDPKPIPVSNRILCDEN